MASKTYSGRGPAKKKVLRRSGKPAVLHCMMIPANGETLLLPTSAMVEVVDYSEPEPVESTPPWLLGQFEWEGRQVPVFSFGALINGGEVEEAPAHARIMILKSLNEGGRVPYLGLLMDDLPRPVQVKEKELHETGDEKKSLGVFCRATLGDDEAIIPDMDRLTHLVTHATFGALPITQLDD
jgi:chemosensory pili system protein ChpC